MLTIQYRHFHKFLIFPLEYKKQMRSNRKKKKKQNQLRGSKMCTMVSTGSVFIPHESQESSLTHSTPMAGLLEQTGIRAPAVPGMVAACGIKLVFVAARSLRHLQREGQDCLWAKSKGHSLDLLLAISQKD